MKKNTLREWTGREGENEEKGLTCARQWIEVSNVGKEPPFLLFSLFLSFAVLRECNGSRCLSGEDGKILLKPRPTVGCSPLPTDR